MGIESRSDVYSFETNLSNVATPIAGGTYFAFFGAAKRGPVDDWYFFDDLDRFLNIYGQPDSSIGYLHYDVIQAFEEGASGVLVRRVVAADATYGGLLVQNKAVSGTRGLTFLNTGTSIMPAGLSTAITTLGAPVDLNDNILYFASTGPAGESTNIAIEIISANLASPTIATVAQATAPLGTVRTANFVASSIYNYYVTAYNQYGETAPSAVATLTYATGGGNQVIVVNLGAPVLGAYGYRVYRTTGTGAAINTARLVGTMLSTDVQFVDFNDGSYSLATPPVASTIPVQPQFTVNIYDNRVSPTTPQESFECSLGSRVNAAGQQTMIESVINAGSQYVNVSNATSYLSIQPVMKSLPKTTLSAGSSGSAISSADCLSAISVLTDKEKYDIAGISDSGYSTLAVQQGIVTTIKSRGRGISLLNIPSSLQKAQDAINYARVTLNTSGDRIAMMTPDHYVTDSYNNQNLYVPPSGKMAGLLAFTDRIRNPGWSPAGYQRGIVSGTIKLRVDYTTTERNQLASANVNYFATERLYGTVLRECYTLTPDFSALSFIPVRRILDVAEESAEKLLKFYLQEPGSDIVTLQMITRLNDLYDQMKGAQMISDYQVVDKTTPLQRAQGNRFIYSIITPLIPNVRIAHTTAVTAQGISFDTIIQALGV